MKLNWIMFLALGFLVSWGCGQGRQSIEDLRVGDPAHGLLDKTQFPMGQSGPEVGGLKLSAGVDQPEYANNEPIELTVTFENRGNQPVNIGECRHYLGNFAILIVGKNGRQPKLTPYGNQQFSISRESSFRMVALEPGARKVTQVPITQLFDITPGETYTVYLQRFHDSKTILPANRVTFYVTHK